MTTIIKNYEKPYQMLVHGAAGTGRNSKLNEMLAGGRQGANSKKSVSFVLQSYVVLCYIIVGQSKTPTTTLGSIASVTLL
jgi:hypothetical protein